MRPSSYKVNSSGINLITTQLRGKVVEHQKEKRVRVPGIEEFLADVGSDASMAASPRPGEVDTELSKKVAASPKPCEVGSEPTLEVAAIADIEEKEDENCDTHFKRKRMSPSPVVSL